MQGVDFTLALWASFGISIVATIVFTACAFTAYNWYTITKDVNYYDRIKPLCIAALISGAVVIILRLTIL